MHHVWRRLFGAAILFGIAAFLSACHTARPADGSLDPRAGTLLAIGGALNDDNAAVYQRFVELASAEDAPPRLVVATAASLNERPGALSRRAVLLSYAPQAEVQTIGRETPADEAVAIIDRATGIFFTGGDQKRITDKYRPGGAATPELLALQRLLARGGVIAGTSAGAAMMSDPMFLTGRSAEALGIASTRPSRAGDDDAESDTPVLGPQIGVGMGLVPWVITDSHFFERDRVGRLVAALESAGMRLGLGVGENACVEISLATGNARGLTEAGSLLVDAGSLRRDGLSRLDLRGLVIHQGASVSLVAPPDAGPPPPSRAPPQPEVFMVTALRDDGRQGSWPFFTHPEGESNTAFWSVMLDGWSLRGRRDGRPNWVNFDVLVDGVP